MDGIRVTKSYARIEDDLDEMIKVDEEARLFDEGKRATEQSNTSAENKQKRMLKKTSDNVGMNQQERADKID